MKKYLLSLLILLSATFTSNGQNFDVDAGELLLIGGVGHGLPADTYITNRMSSTETYLVEITSQNLPSNWNISICSDEYCYPVGVVSFETSLDQNETAYARFDFHYNGNPGAGTIDVRISRVNDPNDKVEITYTAKAYAYYATTLATELEGETNSTVSQWVDFFNDVNTDLDIKMSIVDYDVPNSWDVGICTPNGCFNSSVGFDEFTIEEFGFSLLRVEFYVGNEAGTGTMTVKLENLNNPDEVTLFTFVLEAEDVSTALLDLHKNKSLLTNYPNPFVSSTTIRYVLENSGGLLVVFDGIGRIVQAFDLHSNKGEVVFSSPGKDQVYSYALYNPKGQLVQTKSMLKLN